MVQNGEGVTIKDRDWPVLERLDTEMLRIYGFSDLKKQKLLFSRNNRSCTPRWNFTYLFREKSRSKLIYSLFPLNSFFTISRHFDKDDII